LYRAELINLIDECDNNERRIIYEVTCALRNSLRNDLVRSQES